MNEHDTIPLKQKQKDLDIGQSAIKNFLAMIGRKGGKNSRRKLTTADAQQMAVRSHEARKLNKEAREQEKRATDDAAKQNRHFGKETKG